MVALADIELARHAIAGQIRHTPLLRSAALSARLGCDVLMKLETVQETGSFKIRGAANRIAGLSTAERQCGVVAVSTGNHGRAVAQAARALGVRAVVCMSALVPDNKVDAIKDLGAEVKIVGQNQDEAEVEARRLVAEESLVMVHPFDDPMVIAGQGTIGLELAEDLPDIAHAIVPLSGGGLIGGIARALKTVVPTVRITGVSMACGPAMHASQQAGKPVAIEEEASLADSLGGGIGLDNTHTFALVRELVDEMVLVSEAEIAAGMAHAFFVERLVLEGGAAVGIAALLAERVSAPAGPVVLVLSGQNVDMTRFIEIVNGSPFRKTGERKTGGRAA